MRFTLNGQGQDVPAGWADEPLLFLLREHFGLTGATFGCGVGICGACTIIMDGVAARACMIRSGDMEGLIVRTIEGLTYGENLHPVQQAWLYLAVPQCGYCQAGQIMAAVALLEETPVPVVAGGWSSSRCSNVGGSHVDRRTHRRRIGRMSHDPAWHDPTSSRGPSAFGRGPPRVQSDYRYRRRHGARRRDPDQRFSRKSGRSIYTRSRTR